MHMTDALLSPAVGGALWAVSAVAVAGCARQVRSDLDDRKVPLMGVLGAFVFAAQMINFAIPATGSSGHLGGGLLLAILLGAPAAFLAIASVLTIQALFFADGGLLALGCNMFNLGVLPCFVAYPLLFKPIAGDHRNRARLAAGATLAGIAGVQLGALGVVFETTLSGISALPLHTFCWTMLPIHLAIGLVEGLVTAFVVASVRRARPDLLECAGPVRSRDRAPIAKVVAGLALAAVITGGVLPWFASPLPDGLEWSIERTTGGKAPEPPPRGLHAALAALQEKIALLPDYSFRAGGERQANATSTPAASLPPVDEGATVSGLVGGGLTLLLTVGLGALFGKRRAAGERI